MAEISLTGDQMLTVLEAIAEEGPLSAAEVARHCDINRTVAYRLLSTLAHRAYVRRGEDGYVIGPAALKLAQHIDLDVRSRAKPVMERLALETGETVVLHAIDNLEAVVLDQALGEKHIVRVAHNPGSRHPLSRGASGWSLLAFQDEKLISRVIKKSIDPTAITERIKATRRDGYAITHDELQLGVHGVAVPVVEADGRCQVSLGILVPSNRSALLATYVEQLLRASREIGTFS